MTRIYSTRAKAKIMEFLKEHKDVRFSANDVYNDLVRQGEEINPATVYRNLDKLSEDGSLIRTKSVDSNFMIYQYAGEDHACHDHLHLQCTKCGKIIHLECEFMKEISGHLLGHHGFSVECEGSVIMGLCEDCRKNEGVVS